MPPDARIQVTRLWPRTKENFNGYGFLKTARYYILDSMLIHALSNIHIYFTLVAK